MRSDTTAPDLPSGHNTISSVAKAGQPVRAGKLTIKGLSKSFGDATVYQDFDLELPLGRFVSIFGPNGCGKSTLINMISGLMPMDAGQVLYDGKLISESRLSYVFQNYREALFPWLSAIDNIHYPLKRMKVPKAERAAIVDRLIEDFGIRIDLNAYPYQLSGGQQQAVSIIRALVRDPEVLFLDEPFSALDYEMTLLMREKLQGLFQSTGTTMILVSHDLEEAVQMADEVLMLTKRPTRVAEIITNPMSRPRRAESLTDRAFIDLRTRCLQVFQQEVSQNN